MLPGPPACLPAYLPACVPAYLSASHLLLLLQQQLPTTTATAGSDAADAGSADDVGTGVFTAHYCRARPSFCRLPARTGGPSVSGSGAATAARYPAWLVR